MINLHAILSILLSLPWTMGLATCGTADIAGNSVTGCECPKTFIIPCGQKCTDPHCMSSLHADLKFCHVGCIQGNIDCNACYLYFHSLCHCMKGVTAKNCIQDGDWWLLNNHKLITTTQTIPGILQLGSDNAGWQLGQTQLASPGIPLVSSTATRKTGTLSVNSVLRRTEEQIHIHVCDASSLLRTYLTTIALPGHFKVLAPLPTSFLPNFPTGTIWCQASQTKGDQQVDVAGITAEYLKNANGCEKSRVGAGLITDGNDYSWACITTAQNFSAEDLFCRT